MFSQLPACLDEVILQGSEWSASTYLLRRRQLSVEDRVCGYGRWWPRFCWWGRAIGCGNWEWICKPWNGPPWSKSSCCLGQCCRGHKACSEVGGWGGERERVNSRKLGGQGSTLQPDNVWNVWNLRPLNGWKCMRNFENVMFMWVFVFWNRYIPKENQRCGPSCPSVGGSSDRPF